VQPVNFAESPALRDVAAVPAATVDRSESPEEEEAAENRQVRTVLPPGLLGLLRPAGLDAGKERSRRAALGPHRQTPRLPLLNFDGISNADNFAS